MYSTLRKAAATAVMLLMTLSTMAAVVRGKVNDDLGDPMAQATVKLLAAKDSAFVKGVKCSNAGVYTISNVSAGKYIVQAEYLGYDKSYTNITVGNATVNVPTITLKESSIMLKEVTVTGVRTNKSGGRYGGVQCGIVQDTAQCRGGGPAETSAGRGGGFGWQNHRQRQRGDEDIDRRKGIFQR